MEFNSGTGTTSPARLSVSRLGITPGFVIQEFGYDSDVDDNVRLALEEACGGELADEDFTDMTDAALLWWRDEDGDPHDLADLALDAMGTLDDDGIIWVLTPGVGRINHVPPADVQEAANILGKNATSSIALGEEWVAFTITSRKAK